MIDATIEVRLKQLRAGLIAALAITGSFAGVCGESINHPRLN